MSASDYEMYRTGVGTYVVRRATAEPVAWLVTADDSNRFLGRLVNSGGVRKICMQHDGTSEGEGDAARKVAEIIMCSE